MPNETSPGPYAPPASSSAGIPSGADQPRLFSKTGIGIATFVGGALAAALLVHHNLRAVGRPVHAKQALVLFGAIGIAFVVLAIQAPPDALSLLLTAVMPQLFLVMILLWCTRYGDLDDHTGKEASLWSNWRAFAAGVGANVAVKAVVYCAELLWT